jgi:hypothetical protein
VAFKYLCFEPFLTDGEPNTLHVIITLIRKCKFKVAEILTPAYSPNIVIGYGTFEAVFWAWSITTVT